MRISGTTAVTYAFTARNNENGAAGRRTESAQPASGAAGTPKRTTNVRNATFAEFREVAESLYRNGTISLGQLGVMTLSPALSPQTPGLDINVTRADVSGRRDWIREFKARADRNAGYGNALGARHDREIARILTRFADEADRI